jgi:NodT family efflux transporter outer membrane factor (OMF) lipoprotein
MHFAQHQPLARGARPFGRAVLAVGVTAALFACKTEDPPKPDELRKQALGDMVLPEAWTAGGADAAEIQDNWLASFGDAQLEQLVAEAIAKNPDLRAAGARVEQAAGYLEQARAALKPAVNILGTGGLNASGGDISSALQGLLIGISWEPDLWGRMRYGRNAAEASLASVQADFEFARQSLAASTARSWFTASQTWLQTQIAGEMVRAAEQLVALAETRQRVGVGNEQDVVIARASLGTFQDAERQMQLAHNLSLRALELLLARYPSAELQARHDLPPLPGPVPAGMPLAMLERRPDMVAAERRAAAAFFRVGESKAAMLPKISLNASASVLESDVLQLKDDYSNPSLGAGARLVAPIYQGGALDAAVEIRTAEQKEAVAQYASMALRAISDVETALATGQNLSDREQVLRRALADNERALALANETYRVGRLDLRSVQQQQLSVYSARVTLLLVQSQQLIQRVNLHLSLGGSFEQPPEKPDDQDAQAEPAPQ